MSAALVSGGVLGSRMDETALGLLQFASGATADLLVSVLYESEPAVEIVGTRGTARAWNALNSEGSGHIRVNGRVIEFSAQNPYQSEMETFALCVREHRRPPVDAIEGLRNIQILEAIVSKGVGVSGDMKAE
jgi:predicted dehydrogenase